jgi:phosphoglycolate phosphatase
MPADPPRLVVFDFDGTLADTWRDLATAVNETLADAGLPVLEGPEVKAWIGEGAQKLLARALPEVEAVPGRIELHLERFRAHYDRCCLETTEPYPGIEACLDRLADQPLAILSNKPQRFLERIVEGLDLSKRFFAVLGGDALPQTKPHPAGLHSLRARLDRPPAAVWMVGDSAIDVNTGRAAGARTIGCTWGLRGRAELQEARADVLVDDAREIPDLILSSETQIE